MASWRKFREKQTAKRTNKDKKKDNGAVDEIIIQRMTSEVSSKQQKYNRIGAREYVPFEEYEELSIINIKDACQKFFESQIEKDEICDVLAGERGPSCSKMAQIPDRKVFYVRFVKRQADDYHVDDARENAAYKPTIKKKVSFSMNRSFVIL